MPGSGPLPGSSTVPSTARMYDYYLGGKDNFAVDRAAADAVLSVAPEAEAAARANRRFLVAAVRHLAEQGIDQFIDIGCGIPTSPNVHEVAYDALGRRPRVVYVDNDPVVVSHTRALRAVSYTVVGIAGDLRHPADILSDHVVQRTIDPSRPVAILVIAVLHFLADQDHPEEILDVLHAGTAPGSALVLSHATAPPDNWARAAHAAELYSRHHATAPATVRTPAQIADLLGPWKLADELTPVGKWPKVCDVDGPDLIGGIAYHT